MLDHNGSFDYKHETYNGYSIGKIILDIRTDKVEVEVLYHQPYKNSLKVIKHTFIVPNGEVDIEGLLDKIYKLHY
tara:strand:- start:53 stop:277 length:225 start_codon:yes stop_codon:yes gene_type:complete